MYVALLRIYKALKGFSCELHRGLYRALRALYRTVHDSLNGSTRALRPLYRLFRTPQGTL
jgi:hypothetical protein